MEDTKNGMLLRKTCLSFFNNSYATSYLECSKIRDEYKAEYRSKIHKFKDGALNP